MTIQKEILRNGFVDLEGIRLYPIIGKNNGLFLEPGDLYVAERNGSSQLLTVRKVDHDGGWVESVENARSYSVDECVGVTFLL